jgi:hypothetical protein
VAIFFARTSKVKCDWLVMSSVFVYFVASQSNCFFLCSRKQIRPGEQDYGVGWVRTSKNVFNPIVINLDEKLLDKGHVTDYQGLLFFFAGDGKHRRSL